MGKRGERVASNKSGITKAVTKAVLVEKLENRQLFASGLGINVTQINAATYKAVVQMLRESNTTNIRMWYGFDSYQVRTPERISTFVNKFAHDGFDITLSVNPRKGRHGTPEETRAMFEYIVSQPGMVDSVDRWELGNEPDHERYWNGTLTDFVSDYIAPAASVLHAKGEKVISGGVSWNPEDVRTMVNVGLLDHVDYVGFHPYANNIGALKSRIAALKEIVGGTPIVATEWNARGHENDSDKGAWADEVKAFWPVIQANFEMSHYFAAVVQDTMAGPAGILTKKGRANEPFYSMWMSLDGNSKPVDEKPSEEKPDKEKPDEEKPREEKPREEKPDEDNGTDGDNPDTDTGSGSDDGDNDKGESPRGGGRPNTPNKPKPRPRPEPKPVETGTDGDDGDGGSTVGSKNEEKPAKGGSKGGTKTPPKPSKPVVDRPRRPARPTTGTVTPPAEETPVVAPPPVPVISSMSLINADRDRIVKPYAVISGVTTVDLASTGTDFLSVLASANRRVGSVKFTINGNTIVDSDGTFTLFDEKRGGNLVGDTFEAGKTYTLTVQPFRGPDATGRAGEVSSVTINVIDSNAAPVAVDPANAGMEELRRRQSQRDRMILVMG
ncbi:MAG TPA: hypothetical protein VF595_02830 [Tepidisphaeraceae bacterium]|jgi:hypothetical protein